MHPSRERELPERFSAPPERRFTEIETLSDQLRVPKAASVRGGENGLREKLGVLSAAHEQQACHFERSEMFQSGTRVRLP